MAVVLFYEKEFVPVLIEAKFSKISEWDVGKIDSAHGSNIEKGKMQVLGYNWVGEMPSFCVAAETRRVAVSGVWHPSNAACTTFELSTKVVLAITQT